MVIWGVIRGPAWDRDNRAEARDSYEKMKVKASITRTPIGKSNRLEPGWRVWRYVATIKITNTDSKPHLVGVCVPSNPKKESLYHHTCSGTLPQLPERPVNDDTASSQAAFGLMRQSRGIGEIRWISQMGTHGTAGLISPTSTVSHSTKWPSTTLTN